MSESRVDLKRLSHKISELIVSDLDQPARDSVVIRFTSGAALVLRSGDKDLGITLTTPRGGGSRSNAAADPTRRQREYLHFIKKYIDRFGVAPAEADIQRHFLVSAPSVNQMIRVLERRGFIERERDQSGKAVPRSIRLLCEVWRRQHRMRRDVPEADWKEFRCEGPRTGRG